MPVIEIHTYIKADINVVFDLSRSIDLHLVSAAQTDEKAVAGKTSGLMELGETVTWQAKHFRVTQQLTVGMVELKSPYYFVDEMTNGAFKTMRHEHFFKTTGGKVQMTDVFAYTSPLGILGKLADMLFLKSYMSSFLKSYMSSFLKKRNETIKEIAEDSDKYKKILPLHSGRITQIK